MSKTRFSFKENWYFIRQDIASYLISTALYVVLCLIKECTIQSALYSLFECLIFYLPFWYIRIKFSDTYHSDSWKFCKLCTRCLLCIGVFVIWILPVKYSLFNSLFVAFGCCLILYWVAIEVKQKKGYKRELDNLKEKLVNTPRQQLIDKCHNARLSKRDTEIAELYYIDKWRPKEIWLWLCQHKEYEPIDWDSVHQLLWRIGNKIK